MNPRTKTKVSRRAAVSLSQGVREDAKRARTGGMSMSLYGASHSASLIPARWPIMAWMYPRAYS